jgi:hypothetical protein
LNGDNNLMTFSIVFNSDEGVGYSPFSLGKGYGQIVDPGFVPLPAFNPYGMFYGGWPHFGRQISPSAISDRAVGGAVTPPRPFLVR